MSDQEKKEQEILNQEMSPDEMEDVAGGYCPNLHEHKQCNYGDAIKYGRPIRKWNGTTNCAATVEDGSHCDTNDACYQSEVMYMGLQDCAKAWK